MKLVARFELATKSTNELHLLYRDIFNALAQTQHGSSSRRNCLASLENIQNEINLRVFRP